ncbi:ROK family protein [Nocardia panacis]|uniref:ROK family protein n=1 Tax=Nocardia panacis TaxID=2340916 RepID=UPI001315AAE8|nr:ROK family protein [Nocardia panacis]
MDYAPNLPGWGRAGLVEHLRAALAVDTAIENDINLAAVGELTRGAGTGLRDFVLISIGTGVGMGIVINGELYVGAGGAAGEVSFLPAVDADTTPDAAARGMTETVAAAAGIAHTAGLAGLQTGSVEEIFAAAAAGAPTARAVVAAEGRRIGALITAVTAILDPELIVLGGGIGHNLEPLEAAIADRMVELGPLRPRIVASALGADGVLVGAVSRALDTARTRLFERRAP